MITGNDNREQERKHRFYWMFFINMQQVVQRLKAFACCVVTVNDKHRNLGWRHMCRLCLKLWFKSDWYFCNIIVSRWFWKRLSGNKVPNNHFLKSVQKQSYADVLQNRCSWKLCNLYWSLFLIELKKRLQHRGFPVNIAKFLGTTLFIEHFGDCFCRFDKVTVQ